MCMGIYHPRHNQLPLSIQNFRIRVFFPFCRLSFRSYLVWSPLNSIAESFKITSPISFSLVSLILFSVSVPPDNCMTTKSFFSSIADILTSARVTIKPGVFIGCNRTVRSEVTKPLISCVPARSNTNPSASRMI